MSLKYRQIRTQEQFDEVKTFAASFGHQVDQAQPIVVAEKEGKMIGYFQVLNQPIVTMAYHPDCSPRDFMAFSSEVKAYRTLSSMTDANPNGKVYMLMGEDSVIPESAAEKLGFHFTGLKLFTTQ